MDVELPNGQIAEFPDDMPHEQIQAVLQKHFSPPKVSDDDRARAFQMIKREHPRMPDFMINALMPLAIKMAETPKDTSRGTTAGAFLRSALRTPLEGAENLASLVGLPTDKQTPWPDVIAESESDKSHPFAELGGSLAGFLAPGAGSVAALRSLPGWAGIAERAAPSFLRRLPVMATEGAALGAGFSPEGERASGALSGALLGAAGSALPSVARGAKSLKERISSLRNLDRLKAEGKLSEEDYLKALNDEEALKDLSKQQGLGSNPSQMEAELPEYKKQAETLAQEIQDIPEINTKNMLGAPTGEDLVSQASDTLKTSEQKAADIEKQLSSHLFKGYEHGVPIAEAVVNEIEGTPVKGSTKRIGGLKKEIGSQYDAIEENLKDKDIVVPRNENLKQIEEQARKSLENSRSFFSNDAEYEKTVKQIVEQMAPKSQGSDIIPASNVLSNYRSLKNLSQKLRQKAYSREVAGNKDLQNDMLAKAKDMEGDAESLENLLENHDLGGEVDNLKAANKRWREEITPLYRNSTYQTFLNKGYAPSKDLIYSLRGKGSGQEIIRNIIKKNPTLIRNILGQRYAKTPAKIHEFDQLAQEYIDSAPEETKNLINSHHDALVDVESAKASHAEAQQKAAEMKKEAERVENSFNEQKKTQEMRSKKSTELQELQEKIANLERNIPELKKKANVKNISLQKKLELEAKIAKAEKDVAKLKKQASLAALGVTTSALGTVLGLNLKKPFR